MTSGDPLDDLVGEVNRQKDRLVALTHELVEPEDCADELSAWFCESVDEIVRVAFETGLASAPRRPARRTIGLRRGTH